ncbi:uncharacterized protein TNCV_2969751 [Trichonephila clavipes]|nr:uncharacterized protein TNCV_2969751 [Trichonephila clavipes]
MSRPTLSTALIVESLIRLSTLASTLESPIICETLVFESIKLSLWSAIIVVSRSISVFPPIFLSMPEARKLIVPQLVQTYAKAAKPSIVNNSTQTDENITQIKCPPLNLLQPLSSHPKPNILISTPAISTSSSLTQAELLPPISAKAATVLQPEPPIPMSNVVLSNMFTPIESSSIVSNSLFNDIQPPSTSNTERDSKLNSKTRIRKRKKELLKKLNEEKI